MAISSKISHGMFLAMLFVPELFSVLCFVASVTDSIIDVFNTSTLESAVIFSFCVKAWFNNFTYIVSNVWNILFESFTPEQLLYLLCSILILHFINMWSEQNLKLFPTSKLTIEFEFVLLKYNRSYF